MKHEISQPRADIPKIGQKHGCLDRPMLLSYVAIALTFVFLVEAKIYFVCACKDEFGFRSLTTL